MNNLDLLSLIFLLQFFFIIIFSTIINLTSHIQWSEAAARAVVVRLRRAFVYVNAERSAAAIHRAASEASPSRPLLVNCEELTLLDYTGAQVLARVLKELQDSGRTVVFYKANETMERRLRAVEGLAPQALHAQTVAEALRASAPCSPAQPNAAPAAGEHVALLTVDSTREDV